MNIITAYLIIAAVIVAIIGSLIFVVYLDTSKIQKQTGQIAQYEQQVASYKSSLIALNVDAANTKVNQDWLDSKLNTIRTDIQTTQNKEVITETMLKDPDSVALAALLNKQTSDTLKTFEVLTRNGK